MKKIFTILLFSIASFAYTQSLENTEWDIYINDEFGATARFTADTFYIGTGEGFEFAISTYYTISDTFALTDLEEAGGCFEDYGNVEGRYLFNISNDTLLFSLIEDTCDIRVETLDFAIFVNKMPTSVENVDPFEDVTLYPNPITNGILNIKSDVQFDKINVYDLTGRVLVSTTHTASIDLSNYTDKLFIVTLFKDGLTTSKKVFNR